MTKKKSKGRRVQRRQKQRLKSVVDDQYNAGPGEYTLRHRANRLAEIISAYPQQIAMGLASRDEASWLFGRLYLVGAIDHDQKSAAERLAKAVVTYRRLFHRHYGAKMSVVDPVIIRSSRGEDLSPSAEKAFERASRDYDRNMSVLRSCGYEIEEAVMAALDNDCLSNLSLICDGLNALCGRGGGNGKGL